MTADLDVCWQRIRARETTLVEEAERLGMPAKRLRTQLRRAGLWPDGWHLQRGLIIGKSKRKHAPDPCPWPKPDLQYRARVWDRKHRPGWGD